MNDLRWRLIYPDRTVDEIDGELASISLAPRNALALVVTKGDDVRRPVISGIDTIGKRPIFYRVRSGGFGEGLRTDAVVFGTAVDGEVVQTNLWAFMGGSPIPCPPQYIDQTSIELLL